MITSIPRTVTATAIALSIAATAFAASHEVERYVAILQPMQAYPYPGAGQGSKEPFEGELLFLLQDTFASGEDLHRLFRFPARGMVNLIGIFGGACYFTDGEGTVISVDLNTGERLRLTSSQHGLLQGDGVLYGPQWDQDSVYLDVLDLVHREKRRHLIYEGPDAAGWQLVQGRTGRYCAFLGAPVAEGSALDYPLLILNLENNTRVWESISFLDVSSAQAVPHFDPQHSPRLQYNWSSDIGGTAFWLDETTLGVLAYALVVDGEVHRPPADAFGRQVFAIDLDQKSIEPIPPPPARAPEIRETPESTRASGAIRFDPHHQPSRYVTSSIYYEFQKNGSWKYIELPDQPWQEAAAGGRKRVSPHFSVAADRDETKIYHGPRPISDLESRYFGSPGGVVGYSGFMGSTTGHLLSRDGERILWKGAAGDSQYYDIRNGRVSPILAFGSFAWVSRAALEGSPDEDSEGGTPFSEFAETLSPATRLGEWPWGSGPPDVMEAELRFRLEPISMADKEASLLSFTATIECANGIGAWVTPPGAHAAIRGTIASEEALFVFQEERVQSVSQSEPVYLPPGEILSTQIDFVDALPPGRYTIATSYHSSGAIARADAPILQVDVAGDRSAVRKARAAKLVEQLLVTGLHSQNWRTRWASLIELGDDAFEAIRDALAAIPEDNMNDSDLQHIRFELDRHLQSMDSPEVFQHFALMLNQSGDEQSRACQYMLNILSRCRGFHPDCPVDLVNPARAAIIDGLRGGNAELQAALLQGLDQARIYESKFREAAETIAAGEDDRLVCAALHYMALVTVSELEPEQLCEALPDVVAECGQAIDSFGEPLWIDVFAAAHRKVPECAYVLGELDGFFPDHEQRVRQYLPNYGLPGEAWLRRAASDPTQARYEHSRRMVVEYLEESTGEKRGEFPAASWEEAKDNEEVLAQYRATLEAWAQYVETHPLAFTIP
jgi:hypothetical protein